MAVPDLAPLASRVYDALGEGLTGPDEAHGHALAIYVGALTRSLEEFAAIVSDDAEGRVGWSAIFDPDRCPAGWLPYVAQWIGVTLPPELPVAEQRRRLRDADGWRRGTPAAVRAAVGSRLTGTRTVYLTERHASAWRTTVTTLAHETPLEVLATIAQELRLQKPGGMILRHEVVAGGDFQTLRDTHADFADVRQSFPDFAALRADPARQ